MTSRPDNAGEFSTWLREQRRQLRDNQAADVPCGSCNACCRSAYFIQVHGSEQAALAHIPAALLVPAPGQDNTWVLGFDETGCCPMLVDGRCSIYQHRPHTCRTYDCRIFCAAGQPAGGAEKSAVNTRVAAWQFSYRDRQARQQHQAAQTAARYLLARAQDFPAHTANPTQLALSALRLVELFTHPPADAAELHNRVARHLNTAEADRRTGA